MTALAVTLGGVLGLVLIWAGGLLSTILRERHTHAARVARLNSYITVLHATITDLEAVAKAHARTVHPAGSKLMITKADQDWLAEQ